MTDNKKDKVLPMKATILIGWNEDKNYIEGKLGDIVVATYDPRKGTNNIYLSALDAAFFEIEAKKMLIESMK